MESEELALESDCEVESVAELAAVVAAEDTGDVDVVTSLLVLSTFELVAWLVMAVVESETELVGPGAVEDWEAVEVDATTIVASVVGLVTVGVDEEEVVFTAEVDELNDVVADVVLVGCVDDCEVEKVVET